MMENTKKEHVTELHPFHKEKREARFDYLVGVALGAFADEEPISAQESDFLRTLALSLGLTENDAEHAETIAKKATADAKKNEGMSKVRESLCEGKQKLLFLDDLRRIIDADGKYSQQQSEFYCAFAEFLLILNPKDHSPFVFVSRGDFEMGDGEDKHTVFLEGYYIGKYCVTNEQYAKFVKETGHRPLENNFWDVPERANHPVTNVSWHDALAYAKWAECDLPTEAQWEKAARGPKGYIYPWGNEWDETKCRNSMNKGDETTAPVDAYFKGASGYGTLQQAGNVSEWCYDRYDESYYDSPDALSNPRGPVSNESEAERPRVIRGRDWRCSSESLLRNGSRDGIAPSLRNDFTGFRLAKKA